MLVWAATIWGLWSCWLLAQYTQRVAVTRGSGVLLVAELLALAVHSYGCAEGGCSAAAATADSAASIDVPVLALVLVSVAVAREWRRARAPTRRRSRP